MYLLDTNVISELRRAQQANSNVIEWFRQHADEPTFISVITLMELEMGVRRLENKDIKQGQVLRQWLDAQVKPRFIDTCLAIDTEVALCCARLHVPDPRPDRDALIAATALTHQLTLITRNTKNFVATGVALVNPWQGIDKV